MRKVSLSLGIAGLALVSHGAARADEAADTATARALGIEGVTLADAGRCKDAIEKLERAEKLHHAPTTATRLGECEIETGRLVSGTERLQRVVREPLPPNAHPAFVAAVARAQHVLEKAVPRIATLRISVKAPKGARLALSIDDEPVPDAIVDTNRRIDPGTHKVQASGPGYFASTATATLDEGQTKSIVLELKEDPKAAHEARAQEPGAAPSEYDASASESHGSKVPAFVAFGIGAVGLGVGIYAATVVDQKSSTLDSRCDANRVCPNDLQPEISDAKKWATISTIGFATAGVSVATGVVLLLVSNGGGKAAPKKGVHVQPAIGATSVGIDGRF